MVFKTRNIQPQALLYIIHTERFKLSIMLLFDSKFHTYACFVAIILLLTGRTPVIGKDMQPKHQ